VSRLRANGNVQAQFGAALRGKFDLGARARGGWAGLCKKEAPAMDPLKCVLTKCTPVARTPGAPVRPRGSAHINFDDHLGNEPDPGYGARRKLHAPLISLENHVCAKTPLLSNDCCRLGFCHVISANEREFESRVSTVFPSCFDAFLVGSPWKCTMNSNRTAARPEGA
jgi:hypothetical protein